MSLVQVHDKALVVPWEERFRTLIPDAVKATANGKFVAVMKHAAFEVGILRNIGYHAPAPILTQYDWAGTLPFDSQRTTAAMFSTEERAYCLSTMGVGKTRAGLYAYDFIRRAHPLPLLVVAPLSTLADVWEREIFENFHHLRCVVLHGTKEQRLKLLKEPADVYIINHDGVGVILAELLLMRFAVVIIDELSAYRNASTDRWKYMNALINRPNMRVPAWGLTGSPTPNEPTDAYGLSKLITPWAVGRSVRNFKLQVMTQISQFRWIPKPTANDTVAGILKPSIRYTLDECHDIPELTYSSRHAPMGDKQATLYKMFTEQIRAHYKGNLITAANEAVKVGKLLQISAGFAYSDDKGVYIDFKNRVAEVLNLIEQANKKVLIFANYKFLVTTLGEVLGKYHTVRTITGDTPKRERDETFAMFRKATDPHVIVAHPQTMAHGLNLIEADTIIWYGPTTSSEIYEQANARIRRPGQTCKTHIIHVESSTVEKRAFHRLQHKQKMQGLLLDMLAGEQLA